MARSRPRTILILSQVFVPDPASVGQHMADVAIEMAHRGYRVVVLAANRGYDDPSMKYPSRELRDGVEIRRVPLSSFGKKSLALRLLAGALFVAQCVVRGMFTRRLAGILVSTSPPMCSTGALVIAMVRRVPVKYWVMDLNPDQMIALGRTREDSIPARVFNFLNRLILRRASDVVVLDPFMAERVNRKVNVTEKMWVMPPWPHEDHLENVAHAGNPFREKHGLAGKFVIMNSGNHGTSTPIATLLDAAARLQDRSDIVFMFIGGGVNKEQVNRAISEQNLSNVRSLPYQPISEIKYSLSAADVHVVSVGNEVVGIVHPCKIYGAMALGRPILLLGPDPCHVSALVSENRIGWHVPHGDVDRAVETILRIVQTPPEELAAMGDRARQLIHGQLSKTVLCGRFCDTIERGIGPLQVPRPANA